MNSSKTDTNLANDSSTSEGRRTFFEVLNGKRVFVVTDLVPESKQLVLMSHGFRGTSCGPARQFVEFAELLNKNNISAVRYDQPNCGNSEGLFLDSSFNEWIQTTTSLAKKYIDLGYQVSLMGQSMGATVSVIASAQPSIHNKISSLMLWVPDAKSTTSVDPDKVFEEGGQKYLGKFWQEAAAADFFGCLEKFEGKIQLVYGEHDRYIKPELREQAVEMVKKKGGEVEILPGEDHSPWAFDTAEKIMQRHLLMVKTLTI